MEGVIHTLLSSHFRFIGVWDAKKARQVLQEVQSRIGLDQVRHPRFPHPRSLTRKLTTGFLLQIARQLLTSSEIITSFLEQLVYCDVMFGRELPLKVLSQ